MGLLFKQKLTIANALHVHPYKECMQKYRMNPVSACHSIPVASRCGFV